MEVFQNLFRQLGGSGDAQVEKKSSLTACRRLPFKGNPEYCPLARSGHRMFCDGNFMYIIGGYDKGTGDGGFIFKEVWSYSLFTKRWKRLPWPENGPGNLASHAVAQMSDWGNEVVLYGGSALPFGDTNSNEVSLVTAASQTNCLRFDKITTPSSAPALYGHAMCRSQTERDVFYVVGGTTGRAYFMNVWMVRIVDGKGEWEMISPGDYQHEGLYRLEITHDEVSDRIFMLGGGNTQWVDTFDELNAFNLKTRQFEVVTTKTDQRTRRYPKERRAHSLVRYDRKLFMAGGLTHEEVNEGDVIPDGTVLGDIWAFDLDTLTWTELGHLIIPVYFHDAAVTKDGRMIIWGGVTRAFTDERTNQGQYLYVTPPSLRSLATTAVLEQAPEKEDYCWDDTHSLLSQCALEAEE
ncbi:unnamed protein product, partial [Mesorhabditis spiculigera]